MDFPQNRSFQRVHMFDAAVVYRYPIKVICEPIVEAGCHRQQIDRVTRVPPRVLAVHNCTRDEGGPFGFGNQVLISSHRKLLWSRAMVVSDSGKGLTKIASGVVREDERK